MAETPNHGYNVPEQGEQDWHDPLNANFEAFEVDIELRDEGAPDANGYDPADGAKYLDITTGDVYLADGDSWSQEFSFGGGGGGGISSLSGGDGISPDSIGDGDTLTAAWGDASSLDASGDIGDFSAAADLDAAGSLTADVIGGLSGGAGIDPTDIGDGDTLSVAWGDAAALGSSGEVNDFSGASDLASDGSVDTLSGSLTGGQALTDIAGTNLSIDNNGQLNAAGGSGGGISSLSGGDGISPDSIGDGDTLTAAWGDATSLTASGDIADFSAAADLDAAGSLTADVIGGLSGGAGIDPATIGDGDTVSVAWEDANDLDADGNVTTGGGGISSLTGGDGIDPTDIDDGNTVSVVWADAAALDTDGDIADFSAGTDLDTSGNVTGGTPDDFSNADDLNIAGSVDTLSGSITPSGVTVTDIAGDNLSISGGQLNASGGGGGGISSLTGGDGIDPDSIGDGDTLTAAWGDASSLDAGGNIADFSAAADLDASGTVTRAFVEALSGGEGISPSSIGDGDILSVAWGDAGDLAGDGSVDTLSGSLTGGQSLTDIAGTNLSIDSTGQLNASGGSGGGISSLTGGNGISPDSIGDGDTVSVAPADIAGNALEADGSNNLGVSINGITSNEIATGTITSAQISDGTLGPAELGQSGASDGHVLRWNGSSWETGFPGTTGSDTSFKLEAGGSTAFEILPSGTADPSVKVGVGHSIASFGSTIAGGANNEASASWATVGGGEQNAAGGQHATVSGGRENTTTGDDAVIGGGFNNRAEGEWATIGGGGPTQPGTNPDSTRNIVYDEYGTIGGGGGNQAGTADETTAGYATVSGGRQNSASGSGATVAGGRLNKAQNEQSFVGSGQSNEATAVRSAVVGGLNNTASGLHTTVGGGENNTAGNGSFATVAGGNMNQATKFYATVAGGANNQALAEKATVAGGGWTDTDNRDATANRVYDNFGTVGGGGGNQAGTTDETAATFATVSGGEDNTASGAASTVSGGENNTASNTASTVVGGQDNQASGAYSTAMGRNATANQDGTFVVGNSSSTEVQARNPDEAHFQPLVYCENGMESNGVVSNGSLAVPEIGGNAIASLTNDQLTLDGTATADLFVANPNLGSPQLVFDAGSANSTVSVLDNGDISAGGKVQTFGDSNGLAANFQGDVDVVGTQTFLNGLQSDTGTSVVLNSSNELAVESSSARHKTDIQPHSTGGGVLDLELRSFAYEDTGAEDVGFIAEEVEEHVPEIVTYDDEDRPYGVKYDRVGVHLVPEVRDNRERLDEVESDHEAIDDRVAELEAELEAKDARLEDRKDRIAALEAESEQLREANEHLQDANEQLRERNAELEDRLAAIEDHLGLDSGATTQGVADD